MGCYKSRIVRSALRKKGFAQNHGDHFFYVYYYQGQKTEIRTMVSMGGSHDISDNLITKMKDQLKLTKSEFCGVVDCNISKDALMRIYETKGIVKPLRL